MRGTMLNRPGTFCKPAFSKLWSYGLRACFAGVGVGSDVGACFDHAAGSGDLRLFAERLVTGLFTRDAPYLVGSVRAKT
jgi:hypothetical protein